MSRNEEKAQSMLNRFLRLKDGESKVDKRPYLTSLCDNLGDSDKWRRQIIREINKGINDIQSESLDEYKIRDLNDHINKLMREKHHWEKRIIELGGPNHINSQTSKIFDSDGKLPLGEGIYKYFGMAKTLPGVKELYDKPKDSQSLGTGGGSGKKNKYELLQSIDSDYFGYRDDDDNGILESLELKNEKIEQQKQIDKWKFEQQDKHLSKTNTLKKQISRAYSDEMDIDEESDNTNNNNLEKTQEDIGSEENKFKFHVLLPSKEEMEQIILEKKKQDLREKYLK